MSSSLLLAKLSPEIQSRDRLLYLYSSSNAAAEDVQNFWSKQTCIFCKQLKKSFVFSMNEIVDAYTFHGVRPTYITSTVTELLKRKGDQAVMTDIRSYQRNRGESSDVGELAALFSSLSYVTQLVVPQINSDATTKVNNTKYVSCALLREVQDLLQRYVETLDDTKCVFLVDSNDEFSFSHLTRTFQYQSSENDSFICDFIRNMSLDDQGILLEFLAASNSVVFAEDRRVVKLLKKKMITKPSSVGFFENIFSSPSRANFSSITTVEVARLDLTVSICTLNKRVDELERKAQDFYLKASAYKRSGSSNAALFQLNLRRQALQNRDKILQAVHDLTDASERIDEASINALITEAYRTAASGLRAGREQAGLTPETVEEAVELFRQEMDEMQSVSLAMQEASSTISPLTAEQELDLEEELAALLAAATTAEKGDDSAVEYSKLPQLPLRNRDTAAVNVLPVAKETEITEKKSTAVLS